MPTDPRDLDQPEPDGWELAVPFVACRSEGGEYDDDAFVAGFQCGQISARLAAAKATGADRVSATVRSALVKQLDLIAMDAGFTLAAAVADGAPEWSFATFTAGGTE